MEYIMKPAEGNGPNPCNHVCNGQWVVPLYGIPCVSQTAE
jgi:hypothetical protein